MTRLQRALLAPLAALVLAPSAAAAGPAVALVSSSQLDPRLQELTLSTPALTAPTRVRVLLPSRYDPALRYPVLYLLHGGNGDRTDWTTAGVGEAEQATTGLPLIVVMPDAGKGGWYTDWYNNGAGGPPMWETYHVAELIPWIDGHYRTIADRGHRAIAGLSMGGFGAMSYAARHPDLFAAASSWSGAVDTNTPPEVAAHVLDAISGLDGGQPGSLFGPRETQEVRWRGHNPWDLAANLRGMTLAVRTGTGEFGGPYGGGGDPLEPAVHAMSVSFHGALDAVGIAHVWDDYGPGGHDWPYWNRDLREDLPRFMSTFAHPPAPPTPFTYTAIEPSYDVYGWHVTLDRPVLEFSTLKDASATGFTLQGSGSATVTTPRSFRQGWSYSVTIRSPAGTQARTLRSDAHGRLRIAVSLGPGNAVQEYSAPGSTAGTSVYSATATILSTGRGRPTSARPRARHPRRRAHKCRHARRHRRANRRGVRHPCGSKRRHARARRT